MLIAQMVLSLSPFRFDVCFLVLCAGLQYKFRLVFLIAAVVWILNIIVSEKMMIFFLV
jgi:hypothetical protein